MSTTNDDEYMLEMLVLARSALDEVTPATLDRCSQQFTSSVSVLLHSGLLEQVVQMLLDKVVENRALSNLYAQMCLDRINYDYAQGGVLCFSSSFRDALLNHVQTAFKKSVVDCKKQLENKKVAIMEDQTHSETSNVLELQPDREMIRQCGGICSFIACLYHHEILSPRILNRCLYELFRHAVPVDGVFPDPPYNETLLACATMMIKIVGMTLEDARTFDGKAYIDQTLGHLKLISHNLSQELRWMIDDVMEFRKNGWAEKEANNTEQQPGATIQQQNDTLLNEHKEISDKYQTSMADVVSETDKVNVAKREITQLNQDYETLKEDHAKCQKENELLKAQNEELLAKCHAVSAKSDRFDAMTRELSRLKEEYKNVKEQIPGSSLEEKQQKLLDEDWHSIDQSRLRNEWKNFNSKFNVIHKNIKDLLQQSVSAKDASVLSTNLEKVQKFTEVAESVRDELLKTAGECTNQIQNVVDQLASAPAPFNKEVDDAKLLE